MAWNRVLNYARDINRKVGTTLTTEKAKSIRRNLIIWGIVITALGGIGTILGVSKMFSGVGSFPDDSQCPEMGDSSWYSCKEEASKNHFSRLTSSMFGGFAIVAGCGLVLTLGIVLIQAGLAIVIAGEGAKFLDTAPKCPKCGRSIEENEIYCSKCGTDIRNKVKCSSCGTQNEVNDAFCRNCGNKLS